MTVYDVLIIGAGIAGCAAAKAFGRQGRSVLLVDRSLREPDRIVGELLQPGGVEALARLGLGTCLDGIDALPVKGYHIYWRGEEEASFWFCPPAGSDAQPPEGRSFHHGRFVVKLREAVAGEPKVTVVETTALGILRDGSTGAAIGARCARGDQPPDEYYAHLTILADGCNSNFRSQFPCHRPGSQSKFWGLEMTDARLPFPDYALGVLGSGPPLLIYQIGTRETRILIDIPYKVQETLGTSRDAVKTYIRDRVLPTIPTAIQPHLHEALDAGHLRSMPCSWLSSSVNPIPGLAMLGDTWNMRHPVTGSGMTVALKDAILVSDMLLATRLEESGEVHKVLARFYWKRKAHCASLNVLAQALYFLFASDDNGLEIMQRGFVRYVQGGPQNFAEPAGLMGGTVENPLLLFYHFFIIAFYSMWLHLRNSKFRLTLVALFECLQVFCRAVALIAPWIVAEWWGS